MAFFLLPNVFLFFSGTQEKKDFSAFREAVATITRLEEPTFNHTTASLRQAEAASEREIRYFYFDPNTATKEDFILLGLSPKVSQTILNYRAKGGKFYKKEDLKKLYTLRQEDYTRLEAWVQITSLPVAGTASGQAENEANARLASEKSTSPSLHFPSKEKKMPVAVDINRATTEEWQQLKGVGPAFSRRIINFREKLGGFYSVEQVGETYGLPDSTFQQILPQLQASPVFRKINVNSATLELLKTHPYISHLQATTLLNYRQQHGSLTGIESLKKIKVFSEQDIARLEPYFSFE
jgi:competence ComEA-like helix-hairpin-helix protein